MLIKWEGLDFEIFNRNNYFHDIVLKYRSFCYLTLYDNKNDRSFIYLFKMTGHLFMYIGEFKSDPC